MQLPVDIKALIDEMTNLDTARNTELSLSVYLDPRAPSDLVAHMRGLFTSTSDKLRMTLTYLDASFVPHADDDMAIIVAGKSRGIGAAAAALRASGVPVMVVTTLPATVGRIATECGHAIPEGDLIGPLADADAPVPDAEEPAEQAIDEQAEPYVLTDELADELDERCGTWVVTACRDKKLAFSIAFPFIRRALAIDAVQATSLQNAGIGLVPFIPGADLPIMTLNQAKMALQIAAAYGQEMGKDRAKELLGVVGGAYLCRTLARELTELIPVLGFVIRPGVAYGGTSALGHAVIEYYEGGQDVSGLANVATVAAKSAGNLAQIVRDDPEAAFMRVRKQAGKTASVVTDLVGTYVPVAVEVVTDFVPKARTMVIDYIPVIRDLVTVQIPKAAQAASVLSQVLGKRDEAGEDANAASAAASA